MGAYIQVILPLKLAWIPYYRAPREEVWVGDKVRVRFSGKEYVGVVYRIADELPENLPANKVIGVIRVENNLARISPEEVSLWKNIADYYMCTIGEVYKTAYPAMKLSQEEVQARLSARAQKKADTIRQKEERAAERIDRKIASMKAKVEAARKPETVAKYQAELDAFLAALEAKEAEEKAAETESETAEDNAAAAEIQLSGSQKIAYDNIKKSFKNGKTVLLKGVTGSGKTEIYEKLALEVLDEKKRNVIYLVPEIALSRQLEDRLREVFGERLLVFHSHETVARRGAVASHISQESGYIVLGTRSALFLPHHDLGLIIVDEEHDGSYKQDSPAPRYNGRDVAVMMASLQKGCNIILGSATPSLESSFNAQTGRYALVELNERYHGAADAEVEIIDTIAERRKRGMNGSFSKKLIAHVTRTLEEGGQVILLRSRRSYSPVLQCSECGDIPKCPRCNVPLSYHAPNRLLCHHCGYSSKYDKACGKCGGELVGIGAGTQKIEEEADRIWPDVRIARLDSDVAQDKKQETAIIKDFANGDINILIGTQIVSKGFDFEGVSLVAVLQADSMLGLQDFRADEKAVQLLEQFRGRCGRRGSAGTFVVQTSQPTHPVYRHFTEGASSEMHDRLLSERKDFNYPPFCRLVDIKVMDENEQRAYRMLSAVATEIQIALDGAVASGHASLIGPSRDTLTVSLAKDRMLADSKRRIAGAVAAIEMKYKYDRIIIDVDPA